VGSFTPRPLYSGRKSPRYPFDRRLCGRSFPLHFPLVLGLFYCRYTSIVPKLVSYGVYRTAYNSRFSFLGANNHAAEAPPTPITTTAFSFHFSFTPHRQMLQIKCIQFHEVYTLSYNTNSSVSIANRLWDGQPRTQDSIPGKRKTFLYLHSIYTGSDRFCSLVVRVPGYRSRCPVFNSRRYQIFWEVAGLERGPLSLVRITEELLERKIAAPG
jgi:hypothetical protein